MMQSCDVSVIIPCYNCSNVLRRAVESVWNQAIRPKEVILIDDFSDDFSTREMINKLENHFPKGWIKHYFSEKNEGPGSARNRGMDIADGKYIAFLDSDDIWHKDKLKIQYNFMEKTDTFLCGHCCSIFSYESFNKKIENFSTRKISLTGNLFRNRFATRTVMMRNNEFRFKENKYYSEDFLLWCEILAFGYSAAVLSPIMAYSFDDNPNSLSRRLKKMEIGELESLSILYSDKLITRFQYVAAVVFSQIKYLFRLIKFF